MARPENRAHVYHISLDDYNPNGLFYTTEDAIDDEGVRVELFNTLHQRHPENPPRFGDIAIVDYYNEEDPFYRGMLIVGNNSLIQLELVTHDDDNDDEEYVEERLVPRRFAVPSMFPPKYWSRVIDWTKKIFVEDIGRDLTIDNVYLSQPNREHVSYLTIPFRQADTVYYLVLKGSPFLPNVPKDRIRTIADHTLYNLTSGQAEFAWVASSDITYVDSEHTIELIIHE